MSHTHWGMTINNYDETDLALVRTAYPEFIRKLVYTLERGEEGTPHIQAYIKLRRDQRLSFVKKLFPRGNFQPLTTDTYNLNAERYAQKLDSTAESPAVISNGNPMHNAESVAKKVIMYMIDQFGDEPDHVTLRRESERQLVKEDYTIAKVLVSTAYKAMMKEYFHEMYENLFHVWRESNITIPTHPHTHTDKKFSQDNTTENGEGDAHNSSESEEWVQEADTESETDEGCFRQAYGDDSEGSGSVFSEEDD